MGMMGAGRGDEEEAGPQTPPQAYPGPANTPRSSPTRQINVLHADESALPKLTG